MSRGSRSARRRRRRREQIREQLTFRTGCRFVTASVREMAQEDVVAAIAEDRLAEIRAQDPHPLFVALDIAQEGESTGEIARPGERPVKQRKWWSADAIKSFASKLKDAVAGGIAKLWHGSSHDDKKSVGEIVASWTKQIGDRLHAYLVGWIHDPIAKASFADGKITTGSMEADAVFDTTDPQTWLVQAVKAVKGAVLAGDDAKPGFAGATVMASVQELDNKEDGRVDDPITLTDVRDAIRDNGWDPSKVFGKEDLLADRTVADAMKAEVDGQVEAAVKEKDAEIERLKPDAEAWQKHAANERVVGLVDGSELLKDRPKGEVAYIKRVLTVDLSSVDPEQHQATVDAAVQKHLDVIKDTGMTFEAPKPDGGGGGDDDTPPPKPKAKTGPSTEKITVGGQEGISLIDGQDYTDPEVNRQIPQ